ISLAPENGYACFERLAFLVVDLVRSVAKRSLKLGLVRQQPNLFILPEGDREIHLRKTLFDVRMDAAVGWLLRRLRGFRQVFAGGGPFVAVGGEEREGRYG